MPNIVKNLMVNEYMDRFGSVQVCVIVNYQGLSADDVTQVRTELTEQNLRMFVLKNSIARRVFEEAGKDSLNRFLNQPAAIIYGRDEPVQLAKTVIDLKEERESLKILGGMVDHTPLEPEKIEALSNLPTRDELLAQLATAMKSPVQELGQKLTSPLQKLTKGLADYASDDEDESAEE